MSLAAGPDDVQLAELPRQHHEVSRSIGAGSDKSVTLPFSGDGSLSEPSAELSQKPRWRTTAHRLGERFPRVRRVALYALGPQPPVYMSAPTPLLERIPPRIPIERTIRRWTQPFTNPFILAVVVAAYIIGLAFLTRASWFLGPADAMIGCTATYWPDETTCGLGGAACMPFTNSTFDFRCPAQCGTVILANQRPVGAQQVGYTPFVVGGGDQQEGSSGTYRGDSFLCQAAIHAGYVSESRGGCATVNLVGTFSDFIASSARGIHSVGFPGEFPLSLRFTKSDRYTHCSDLHNEATIMNVIVSVLLFLVLRPHPIMLFWSLVCLGYWHIALFADPRSMPPDLEGAFADFLPTLFVAYAIWRVAYRHCFLHFSEIPLERALWYLPAYWVGISWKVTFEKLPLDRLLVSDIKARSGAIATLVVFIIIIFACVVNQLRVIRKTGWTFWVLWRYAVAGLVILVLAMLPNLVFRLHHYFAALLLLPLTAYPTRLSLLYQALCLGMFLDGVAKFRFDSILQSPDVIRRDAPLGSSLPVLLTNSTTWNPTTPWENQTLTWETYPATDEGWNGFSLIIDDVQQYVGDALNFSLALLEPTLTHFFRIAFTKDGASGDSTKGATLFPNGTWVDAAPGAA